MKIVESTITVGRVLDLAMVAQAIGCCKRTILRWVEQGEFPEPSWKVGPRPRWYESDVVEWIEKRRSERGA